ncbi:TetR/AcrR family transcriptional regulator [Streptomyces boninensis]|uniref:TetR/AcrR family transcriptional regulator n=1 Tax=Streptomyces boninensis TaxID=2039455 RepID=UPI003B224C00
MPDPSDDRADDRPYHHGNLRTALLDAAEERLREQGAERLSLRDLARAIGVSHGAPRRHFADRQALLDALAVAGFGRLDATLRAALEDAGPDFPARLRAAMHTYVRFAAENTALLELMYARKHRPDADRIVESAEAALGLMTDLILQGQAEGALQQGPPERIGIVLFATLQGIATLTTVDFVPPELLDGLVEDAAGQFLRGAAPHE